MTSRRPFGALVLLVALLLSLAGCAGDGDDSAASRSDSSGEGADAADSEESPTGAALAAGAQVQGEAREVIYTADLVVRVDDIESATERARDLVVAADGFVGAQSADLEGDPHVSITLRVPADEFDGLLDELAALGDVVSRELQSRDVTDQVVDLERRIGNARVSADRLRELLAEADGIPNVLAIEAELTKRETEIEVMSGQLQVVRDQVDLSTLTVQLTEESGADPEVNDDLPGFVRSFKAGGVAVANIGLGLLAVIGFLLPFVPIVALGWFAVRVYRKRRPKPTHVPAASLAGWPAQTPPASTWTPAAPPPPPTGTTPPAAGPGSAGVPTVRSGEAQPAPEDGSTTDDA